MYSTLGSLRNNLLNQSNDFEDVTLNVDTNITSEFSNFCWLLLISKSVWALKMFLYALCLPADVEKVSITDRYLMQI